MHTIQPPPAGHAPPASLELSGDFQHLDSFSTRAELLSNTRDAALRKFGTWQCQHRPRIRPTFFVVTVPTPDTFLASLSGISA